MIKINLLAEGKRPTAVRRARPALALAGRDWSPILLLAGLVVGLLAFGIHWFLLHRTIKQKDREIAEAQREVDELAPIIKEVEDFKAKKAELERKIAIINDLKLNQRGPVQIMDHISRALPELLWLDRMEVTASTITLTGQAFNTNAIANFIENLDKVPQFQEPILRDTQQRTTPVGPVYTYVINFNYTVTVQAAAGGEATGAPTGG